MGGGKEMMGQRRLGLRCKWLGHSIYVVRVQCIRNVASNHLNTSTICGVRSPPQLQTYIHQAWRFNWL